MHVAEEGPLFDLVRAQQRQRCAGPSSAASDILVAGREEKFGSQSEGSVSVFHEAPLDAGRHVVDAGRSRGRRRKRQELERGQVLRSGRCVNARPDPVVLNDSALDELFAQRIHASAHRSSCNTGRLYQ